MCRPRKWTSPKKMEKACDEYFVLKKEEGKRPTTSGLALHLGFCERASLFDYKQDPKFSCVIKKALMNIEEWLEGNMANKGKTAGCIFGLLNMRTGWSNKQEVSHDISGEAAEYLKVINGGQNS